MIGWKIYFWVYLIFTAIGLVYLSQTIFLWTFADWSNLVMSILLGIGIYNYTFKKRVFSSSFWKYFFWITLGLSVFNLIYAFLLPEDLKIPLKRFVDNSYPVSIAELLLSTLFSLSGLYVVYQISKSKNKSIR